MIDVDTRPDVEQFLRKRLNGQFFVPVLYDSDTAQLVAGWERERIEQFLK